MTHAHCADRCWNPSTVLMCAFFLLVFYCLGLSGVNFFCCNSLQKALSTQYIDKKLMLFWVCCSDCDVCQNYSYCTWANHNNKAQRTYTTECISFFVYCCCCRCCRSTIWFLEFLGMFDFKPRLVRSHSVISNKLLWLPIEGTHTDSYTHKFTGWHTNTTEPLSYHVAATVAAAAINETKAKINICQPLHNGLLVAVRLKESDRCSFYHKCERLSINRHINSHTISVHKRKRERQGKEREVHKNLQRLRKSTKH